MTERMRTRLERLAAALGHQHPDRGVIEMPRAVSLQGREAEAAWLAEELRRRQAAGQGRGVLVVPGAMTQAEWLAEAAHQQASLQQEEAR